MTDNQQQPMGGQQAGGNPQPQGGQQSGGNPPPPPPPPPAQSAGQQPVAGQQPSAMTPPQQQQAGGQPMGSAPQTQQGGNPPPPPPPPPPAQAGGQQPAAQQGPPPPRPGDNVPQGGLDPTQVFASPPPPPPGQGDGSQPAPQADQGPPPPPAGPLPTDEQLKAAGYDDEDIRVLKEVGDYRFGSIAQTVSNDNITMPAHPETNFDETAFLTFLRGSISLTKDEKWRIIQAIPKLSQFQIDELQKILEEEKRKFSALSPKHLLQLQKLEHKHTEDWRDLQSLTVQDQAKEQESAEAEEIRKQLGL